MIEYKVSPKKNPINKEVKYYAQSVTPKVVNLDAVIKNIEKTTSLSSADVKACLDALQYEFIENLKHGRSVRLGDVGSFRTSVQSRGALSEDEFSVAHIKNVKVVFSPSGKLRKSLQPNADGVSFQRVQFEGKEQEEEEA